MAREIAHGLADSGVNVKLYDIAQSDSTDIFKEMLDAKGFIIGSSTHDNGMLPVIASFMQLLKGFKPKGRKASVFGSYGWGGGAIKEIEEILRKTGIEVVKEGLSINYVPDEKELRRCYDYGKEFAHSVIV
ncbi:MAG: flavodoxin domain-containing protein [bacterium]